MCIVMVSFYTSACLVSNGADSSLTITVPQVHQKMCQNSTLSALHVG